MCCHTLPVEDCEQVSCQLKVTWHQIQSRGSVFQNTFQSMSSTESKLEKNLIRASH